MLPVLGLLRTYACPYAMTGLCARPNCFYSHKKSDIQQAKKKFSAQVLLPQTEDTTSSNDEVKAEAKIQSGPTASASKQPTSSSSRKREAKATTESMTDKPPEKRHRTSNDSKKAQESDPVPRIKHTSSKSGSVTEKPKNNTTRDEKGKNISKESGTNGIKCGQQSSKANKSATKVKESKDATKVEKKHKKPSEEAVDEAKQFMLPETESGDDDDADVIALECLQMFNNYKPDPDEQKATKPKVETDPPKEDIARNKRLAHAGASDLAKTKESGRPRPRISASETMMKRYEQAKQPTQVVTTEQKTPTTPTQSCSSADGKKRIAHVANVSSLTKPTPGTSSSSMEKKPLTTSSSSSSTVAQTNIKGESRLAHKPKLAAESIPAPKIPWESIKSSKIPVVVRQKILDQLFQECQKIYDDPQDAAKRALAEEKELSTRCSAKSVYCCSGSNAVNRLRKEVNVESASGSGKGGAISHLRVIAGASGARTSWSIESVKKMAWPPAGPLLYIGLKRYLLTEEQLVENSFPRRNPMGGGRAIVTSPNYAKAKPTIDLNAQPFLRICDRCTKSYRVDENGFPVNREKCVYHNGRKFKRKVNGLLEGRYTCCDGDVSAEGCSLSDYHVTVQSTNQLRGFVAAIKDPGDEDTMGSDSWDIIALDCEMIYTTHGNELARVTIIGYNKKVLYDELVKPIHPVLDYNTKFSGITETMLDSATKTLPDVQAVLLTRLRPNTIIVGHSLENDLLALKLIHSTVVDTSVLFPHRLGPPLKRALRNLSTECLGKIIQMGEGGHDSAEDARSALELALWKLKEDSKLQDCFSKT